jgi:type IV pilus assembly protein PilY1
MKILSTIGAPAVLLAIILVIVPFPSAAAVMTDYCQMPPLKSEVSPNIMLTIDVSGSMGWEAYSYGDNDNNNDGMLDNYVAGTTYEGYFDPSKTYKLVAGVYEETPASGVPCQTTTTCKPTGWQCRSNNTGGCDARGTHGCAGNRYACCISYETTGNCDSMSGNYLNYAHMARIDLVRWAMTGGRPSSCNASFSGAYCDPEAWADSGNSTKVGSACNNSLDVDGDGVADGGCILWADDGTKVKARWERITGVNLVTGVTGSNYGLAFQFARMPVVPRMGAMFYSDNGVRADKVYLGDFTGANSKTAYNFYNMIATVNSQNPSGSTPTGPALWDTFNYFAMKSPQYGGFAAQSGAGDRWKNPMYTCQNGGTNCVFLPCTDSFVILMSDGQWNQGGNSGSVTSTCSIDTGNVNSADPVVPAYRMHNTFQNVASAVNTKVRATYGIGLFLGGSGELAMKNISMYGSFDTSSGKTWPDSRTDFPRSTCTAVDCGSTAKGSPCTALPASSADWDTDGDGVPDTFYSGNNATEIKDSLMAAVLDILTHTSAGTAASVLASREGSGANLLQAVYYPKKPFSNGTVDWAGNLQNLWYYIDPEFKNSNIREDGRDASGTHDFILNLKTGGATQKDFITAFYFDSGLQAAMADRWTDDDGDASIVGETKQTPIKVDNIANIWEAGQLLWNMWPYQRTVYTANVSGAATANNLISFSCTPASCPYAATLKPYLNATDSTGVLNNDVASTIMQWTLGADYPSSGTYVPSYRKRLAIIGGTSKVWKLGDIINSTPKISTWQPVGDYHRIYTDSTYGPPVDVYQSAPADATKYTTGYQYKGRGMVYTGSNDGMLHAFRLGMLQSRWTGQGGYEKAKLTNSVCSANKNIYCTKDSQCPSPGETCSATVTLGEEVWAFIPKNALPYLKYNADPNYCHLYSVDLTPTIVDASIGSAGCLQANYYDCIRQASHWRTVLIGGMRLGGACREPASTCTDCVKTPISDPTNAAKGLGYSSYFALDITDQNNPKLLWEYDGTVKNSDGTYTNKLGFSYSGPAVLRINNPALGSVAKTRNGRWLVVFGSGPTGPIASWAKQSLGKSDQNLSLHVFDLATGPGADNSAVTIIEPTISGAPIANGFAGSITNPTSDIDLDYSDDVLYVPYTYGASGLNGGLGRLVTYGNINPVNWKWSNVMVEAGPMTAAPGLLIFKPTGDQWLFFGTGRYFYDTVINTDDSDPLKRRQLFGMKEMCLNATKNGFLTTCPAPVNFNCTEPRLVASCGLAAGGKLTNVDNIAVANTLESTNAVETDPSYIGWYIDLDPALPAGAPTYFGERMITNPAVDGSGIIYYTTFKPQNDPCYKGGQTNIWALKFDTGGAATGLIQGTAIIQVSTGSIEQVDLSTAFTQRDLRRTLGMAGQPPMREGLTVMPAETGVSKPLFMKER